MSQLSDFLNEHNLTAEQVVAESKVAEKLSAADRARYVERASARRAKKSYEEASADKPGGLRRGVAHRTLSLALSGKPITRSNRKKIARAVERLLENETEVTVQKLFADVHALNHKKSEGEED